MIFCYRAKITLIPVSFLTLFSVDRLPVSSVMSFCEIIIIIILFVYPDDCFYFNLFSFMVVSHIECPVEEQNKYVFSK